MRSGCSLRKRSPLFQETILDIYNGLSRKLFVTYINVSGISV